MSLANIECPPGCVAQDFVCRLTSNQNKATIALGKTLENVIGVYIRDINIRAPSGSSLTPNLWSLRFKGEGLHIDTASNVGDGFAFPIISATNSFIDYTIPRLVARRNRGRVVSVSIELTNADSGADVTFADASITLCFVMKPPQIETIGGIISNAAHRDLALGTFAPYGQNARWNQ